MFMNICWYGFHVYLASRRCNLDNLNLFLYFGMNFAYSDLSLWLSFGFALAEYPNGIICPAGVFRKCEAMRSGGVRSSARELRLLLTEGGGGGGGSVWVFRRFNGNSGSSECSVICCLVVSPLVLDFVGISCGVFYLDSGVFIYISLSIL